MILIDAVFINNSGGKVLLDYLIANVESSKIKVCYLLDSRVKGNHPHINSNKVYYIPASLLKRDSFYRNEGENYEKVLCFGNVPPSIRLKATVYTYFHQPLFIKTPNDLPKIQKLKIFFKTCVLNLAKCNTDIWLVQSEFIKSGLKNKYKIKPSLINVLPFYPKLFSSKTIGRVKNKFVYVSGNAPHKNQNRLVNSFVKFYDCFKSGELHLTIGSENTELCARLTELIAQGYPIFNHGFIERSELISLYRSSEYSIYPSLTESFGLGIIEALENGCKIIGADRPYMYAICNPSLSFEPESEESIIEAFKTAVFENLSESKQLVFDQVENLIRLLDNVKTTN